MGELDEVGRLRAYVADLQSSLNGHLAALGSHERLEVDGEWGEHTALAFGRVCRVLGLEPVRNVRTFRLVIGATQQRTAEELARAQADGAAYAQRLRHHFAHEGAGNDNGGGGGGGAPPAATPSRARSAAAAGASRPWSSVRRGARASPSRWRARCSRRRPAFATSSATTPCATRSRARREACWR